MAAKHKSRYPANRSAFDIFLDQYWPLWREPKNQGSVRWHDLRAAFEAGQKAKPPKPAGPDCPNWPRCQCVTRGFINHAEHNDCGKKPATPQKVRPYDYGGDDIVDRMFGG